MIAKTGIRRVADDQVNLSFFQQFCTADRSTVGDFDPDIWKFLMEFLEIMNQIIATDRITGTDAELAFEHIVTGKKGFSLIQHLYCWFYMLQQKFSFRGKEDFFCAADKKCVIQLFFQCFDRLTDCRL